MNAIVNSEDFIERMAADRELRHCVQKIYNAVAKYRYTYNFNWLGRPIIQMPQDIVAMQELIWSVKPDVVVECGVAHGGSLVLYASILELIGERGRVIGIDIDIRAHNRSDLENHPLYHRIELIEGSSIDGNTVDAVSGWISPDDRVLVVLDSNHTHDHVLSELQLYSSFVNKGSYVVVFDTLIDDMPDGTYPDRPWGAGNNPKTAVAEFLSINDRFMVDTEFENTLMMTVAPGGYLKCVKN